MLLTSESLRVVLTVYRGGDANKAVSIIFGVVMGDGVAKGLDKGLLRLPLGEDCVQRYETKVKGMEKNLEALKKLVLGLDVDE